MKAHGRELPVGFGIKEKCLRHNVVVKYKQVCPECKRLERVKAPEVTPVGTTG